MPPTDVAATPAADIGALRVSRSGWKTDFSKHTIPLGEIQSGGPPRDGIPPIESPKFVGPAEAGEWLKADEPVVVYEEGGDARAYPLQILIWHEIVNDTVGGAPIVVLHRAGTASALDKASIAGSRDVGSTGVFEPLVEGRPLTFRAEGGHLVDNKSGSEWNVLGHATAGPLAGNRLPPITHGNHFWFAWSVFKPATRIWSP